MFSGRKSEECKKERWTERRVGHVVNNFRVELPPPFRGDDQKPFTTWIKQFEAAVRAQTRGASTAGYMDTLANILPTRLDGAAFLLWDSLPGHVQCDYGRVKERLDEAFGMKQFLLYFQTYVNAWPHQVNDFMQRFTG